MHRQHEAMEEESEPQDTEDPSKEEEATLEHCFLAWGTLPGEVQTVGRAEVTAAVRLLETTAGAVVLWTDYKALVDGFGRGRRYTLGCSRMADLWATFWEALDARPGGQQQVQIKKIKAHQSLASVRAGKAESTLRQ